MTSNHASDLERFPDDGPLDETDVALRAYFTRLSDERLAEYDPAWTDDRVIEWDGSFRSDGQLMLTCCERDVDIVEYRHVLAKHIAYRNSVASADETSGATP